MSCNWWFKNNRLHIYIIRTYNIFSREARKILLIRIYNHLSRKSTYMVIFVTYQKYNFPEIYFLFLREKFRDFFIISEIVRRSKNIQCSYRFGQVKLKIYNWTLTDTFRSYMAGIFEMSIILKVSPTPKSELFGDGHCMALRSRGDQPRL